MSKILSCWFWKSKTFLKKEYQNVSSDVKTEPIVKSDTDYAPSNEFKTTSPAFFKRSDYLNKDTICFKKLTGSRTYRKKRKSYPVSPKKSLFEDKLSLSDQNLYTMSKENFYNKYKYSPLIYAASTPQNASGFKPRATLGSREPFPFEVPKDSAPRQSLFYELRYGDTGSSTDINTNSKYVAEKPMEDHRNLSFSKRNQHSKSSAHKPLYLQENLLSQNGKNNLKTHTQGRPVSFIKTPRESVKKVSMQADGIVTSPNKSLVRRLSLKPQKNSAVLITAEGKLLHPVHADKVRKSSIKPNNETQPVRVSVTAPVKNLEFEEAVPTVLARRSFRRSSSRRSFVESEQENKFKRLSASPDWNFAGQEDLEMTPVNPVRNQSPASVEHYLDEGVVDNIEEDFKDQPFPYTLKDNEQAIYAVPVVPTRGRTRSVVQQSVKSLTSKNNKEEPAVYRKNIRYSLDTDIFSAETRRRSVTTASPGYVNMERGQPMLVSEVLNPITSLFISDLKNPIPKDPLRKPKEANNWVKPKRYSVQRSSVSKPLPPKPATRVYQESSPPKTRAVPVQRRISRKSYHNYRDESSSSNESIVVYSKKSKQSAPQRSYHHAVYAAQMPETVLPQHTNLRNSRFSASKEFNPPGTSSSKDVCGLSLGNEKSHSKNEQLACNIKMVSSAQQTDLEDEIDLICYPSESVLKKSVVSSESGSKLRWRIIIKRGEEK